MKMRINKFIAAHTNYSRRKADELIRQKRVKVNNRLAEVGEQIDPDNDSITVDFRIINAGKQKMEYYCVYKPLNTIVTKSDEKHRPIIYDTLPDKFRKFNPAGRLDFDSEGILIMTNDGDFLNYIIHPSSDVQKQYRAKIFGSLGNEEIERLKRGVHYQGETYRLDRVDIVSYNRNTDKSDIRIVISHGKNREIRNALKSIGHPVISLKRTAVGNIDLDFLGPRAYRKFDKSYFKPEVE